ncbi:MAG: universal stress protein [Saprospiraceae bacterium]
MEIKIYGTGTSGHQMVYEKLNECLTKAGISFHMENIENVSSFIHNMLHSIPAIRVDDKDLYEISMNGRFNSSLRSAIQHILRKLKYGSMLKIIVPTDFSEVSFNAYNFANGIAKQLNGVLYITHIYFPNSTNVNEIAYVDHNAETIYKQKLDDFVASINQDWIGEFVKEPFVESKFITGFPHKELQALSTEPDTIIVMGSTGQGDQFKKIFGSLSLDIMKSSKSPVFVVPNGIQFNGLRHLLFCSENVSADAGAIVKAGEFAQKMDATLHVAHIVTKVSDDYKMEELEELLSKYNPNLQYQIHYVEDKSPIPGIEKIIHKIPIDLLVFNIKHRNFFSNLIHESVTEHVALYTEKPILVFHQD